MNQLAKVDLETLAVMAVLDSVPDAFAVASLDDLADMAWYGMPGIGYWPIERSDPSFDPATETLDAPIAMTPVPARKVVTVQATKRALTADELLPRREARKAEITAKRDAVIDAGFSFGGKVFQSRIGDRLNISGGVQMALLAIQAGAPPTSATWHGGSEPFTWIAMDNTQVPMTAQGMIQLGQAAGAFVAAVTLHARALKDQVDAAADPMSIDIEAGWPAA